MTTTMEQNILNNWSEYERMCKAECERFARYNGHKRYAWVHERNILYDVETYADRERMPDNKASTRQQIRDRCSRIVELHNQGMTWAKIAQVMGTPIRNIGRVLRSRGYQPNV